MNSIPLPARVLGLAGMIPFVLCAAAVWTPTPWVQLEGLRMQMGYSAVILTFLGGVHWGKALQNKDGAEMPWGRLIWSVTPSLIAWIVLRLQPGAALIFFMAAFTLAFFVDRRAVNDGFFPDWYLDLRKILTLSVLFCLAATLARFFAGGAT